MTTDLIERLLAGDRRALARLVSLIENNAPESRPALAQLHARGGHAHIIGVTGSPGAGKSTLVTQLARELRRRESRVAIIAVDPTSPFTGGAILGDRIRMAELAGDPNVYIRSMASRGSVGGLSSATRDVTRALDAAGFDHIIIETVGAGQAEVEIVRAAQSIVVVTVPGMGDDIQALKAGILEIADVFCVNKADRPGADQTVAELRVLLSLDAQRGPHDWKPPIVKTIAATGEGVPALADALAKHAAYLHETGQIVARGERQARSELLALLYQSLLAQLNMTVGPAAFDQIIADVAARRVDPYSASADLARRLGIGVSASEWSAPNAKESMKQAIQIGQAAPDCALPDDAGQTVTLSALWRGKPLLLVFLRHFGWPHCRALVAQLRREEVSIAQAGIAIALIGMGTPEQARDFRQEFDLPFILLCDPRKESYQAYGLLRLNPLRETRPSTVRQYLAEMRQHGGQMVTPGQDVVQLGGIFLIDTCGVVRWRHLSLRIADYPPITDILALPEIGEQK